ncbi:MAG TPA: helix-turn-helix transcriptional regulator [Longimicrobiales bacterium]|nr:helix-turn-helix transcriptional regulator [Longimicrobiales bacterium]
MTPPLPRYAEHPPSPALRSVVECYWTTRGAHPPGTSLEHRVLPDGCMDVIFDLGSFRADVIGTMTRPLGVRQEGTVDLVGVRFRPGAAPSAVGIPADACVDSSLDLGETWQDEAPTLLDRLGSTADLAERLEVLDRVLEIRFDRTPPDGLVLAAARSLGRDPPPSVAELSDALGVGRRTLERRFRAGVGLSPWQLARVDRFRRAVALLPRRSLGLSRVALAAGYHDQPHMNRDFRELAGVTPAEYRRGSAEPSPAAP